MAMPKGPRPPKAPGPPKNTMSEAIRKAGRQFVEYKIEEDGQWVKKKARRETIAAQSMWALAMKGNITAFKAIYEVQNGPPESKLTLDAKFASTAALLPLQDDDLTRKQMFEAILAQARKRQASGAKDVTPEPEPVKPSAIIRPADPEPEAASEPETAASDSSDAEAGVF